MKKFAYFLNVFVLGVLLVATEGCKKKDKEDPKPDLAASIAGTYDISYMNYNGIETELPVTTPAGTITGKIIITRVDANTVSGKFIVTGEEDTDLENVTVKDEGRGEVGLYHGTQQVGSVEDGQLEISGSDGQNTFEIRAEK